MANTEHMAILKQAVRVWNELGLQSLNTTPDLAEAELSETNLNEADLNCAGLILADLSRANLNEANLSGANLTTADLTATALTAASLSRAWLKENDFKSAMIWETLLGSVDLSTAKGLEQADGS
jgi:uncharacterized protein YjbI with pentapeptide repeats